MLALSLASLLLTAGGTCLALAPSRTAGAPAAQPPCQQAAQPSVLAVWSATRSELASPSAVVLGPQGQLWVLTAGDHRVRYFGTTGKQRLSFGGFGSTAGHLRDPQGLELHGEHVFVADTGNHRIEVFDRQGSWLATLGKRGFAPGQLLAPRGLAALGKRLAVADTGNHRVQILDCETGRSELVIGQRGSGPGQFESPHDVAWLDDGRLAVVDTGNHRVQIFSHKGAFERELGTWGWLPGTFAHPIGIAAAPGGFYVLERDNHRVSVFDLEADWVGGWGLHAILPREGQGKLHYPVAIDVLGELAALAEESVDRVQLFGPGAETDTARAEVAEAQPAQTTHFGPGLACDGPLLAVVRPESAQVGIFDLQLGEPIEITRFGNYGAQTGSFREPADVLLDARSDRIWVSDRGNRTLSVFRIGRDPKGPLRQLPRPPRFSKDLAFEQLPDEVLAALGGRVPRPGRLAARSGDPSRPDVVSGLGAASGPDALFVVDEEHARVLELSPDFELLAIYGGPGELEQPIDLAWHPRTAQLLVLDAAARKVQVFELQARADAPGTSDGSPVSASHDFGAQGVGPARFQQVGGLAVDAAGWLWIVDRQAAGLQRLSAFGDNARTIGSSGLGRLEFYKPSGIAALAGGGVVVVDEGNHRLQFLDADAGYLRVFGARLYTRDAERKR